MIADAGPLIALARIGHLELLRQLFGVVTLTPVVAAEIGVDRWGEITSCRAGAAAIGEALLAGWLIIMDPGTDLETEPLNPGVDPGERSSIALALHRKAAGQRVLLIVDDRCARAEARSQGLAILGTAAVLVLAKEQTFIPASAPLLIALRDQGYFLSDALVAAVLEQSGEA